jgi:hypothetical protein
LLLGVGALGIAAVAASAEAPARITLQLRHVGAEQAAAQLSHELGAPIRVEGTRKAPLSVELTDVSGREALDAIAGVANGRWQRLYVVSGRGKGGGPGRLPSGRLLTLSVENTKASIAVGMIAKAAGARWELDEVPDKVVTLTAESEPVETILDRLAKEAGVVWRAEYVLTVAEPAPTAAPAAAPGLSPRRGGTTGRGSGARGRDGMRVQPGPNESWGPPRPGRDFTAGGGLPRNPPAEQALCQASFYKYLFQLPRTKREPFIQNLAEELKGGVGAAPPGQSSNIAAQMRFEHQMRLKAIVTQIRSLPSAQQNELKTILDVVQKGMQAGTESGVVGVGQ